MDNMMSKTLALLGFIGLMSGAAPDTVSAADWKSDTAGSKLEFFATFEGSPVPGVFKDFDARLRLDPENAAGGSLEVTIKVASADMSIPGAQNPHCVA